MGKKDWVQVSGVWQEVGGSGEGGLGAGAECQAPGHERGGWAWLNPEL